MTTNTLNPDELANAARVALERSVDTKVDAVRGLVEKSLHAEQAEQRAADARSALDAAWTAALSTGWTDKELRGLGLTAPGQPRPRAPRKRRGDAAVEAAADA